MHQGVDYFRYFHSILRYFILLFTVIVALQSLLGMLTKKKLTTINKQMALVLLICCDLQLILGLALYFMQGWFSTLTSGGDLMTNPYKRFWTVEHSLGMIIAIVLIHIGYRITKKKMDDDRKLKKLFYCTLAALIIFLAMIPWQGKPAVGRPNIPSLHEG